ncbi:MAG: glycosyltransferase family 2 protein [Bacteroidota bacterium]
MLISLIIPVYNEEDNICMLYSRITDIIKKLSNTDYEFCFVNDGSEDSSIDIIKNLALKDKKVKYIDFSRNFGHQIAVSAALDHVKGDVAIIIDADLQDPPELIFDMLKKYDEGYQVVYAKRNQRDGESWIKKISAKLFYRLLKMITSVHIPLDTGDFRLIDRKIIDVLKEMPERHKFLRGQISWIGFNQTFVSYNRDKRQAGETGYTYKKMFRLAMDGITAFSDFPLKLATIMGFFVSIIAFLIMIYALWAKFIWNDTVPGWTSLIISIMFIGGIQLICVGLLGEYIGRMGDNIKKRPLYIVKNSNIKADRN